jgi:hypothetical protein
MLMLYEHTLWFGSTGKVLYMSLRDLRGKLCGRIAKTEPPSPNTSAGVEDVEIISSTPAGTADMETRGAGQLTWGVSKVRMIGRDRPGQMQQLC